MLRLSKDVSILLIIFYIPSSATTKFEFRGNFLVSKSVKPSKTEMCPDLNSNCFPGGTVKKNIVKW